MALAFPLRLQVSYKLLFEMRTDFLVLGAAIFSSVVDSATIHLGPPTHTQSGVVPELPDLVEKPTSWGDRLRGLSERLLWRTRHGLRVHEQKHLGLASSQMSKYAGDIVLRFKLNTQAEGKALVEASQVLLLDVWSSTKEHVDIRLPERDVSFVMSYIGYISHAHLGPLASWAPSKYFATCSYPPDV